MPLVSWAHGPASAIERHFGHSFNGQPTGQFAASDSSPEFTVLLLESQFRAIADGLSSADTIEQRIPEIDPLCRKLLEQSKGLDEQSRAVAVSAVAKLVLASDALKTAVADGHTDRARSEIENADQALRTLWQLYPR